MSHGGHGAPSVPHDAVEVRPGHFLHQLPKLLLAAGALALIAGIGYGLATDPRRMSFAYLTAFAYWLSLGLGSMFFVLVQHAARAGWSVTVRRVAEAGMAPIWLFGPLFAVLIWRLHDLYHWAHHGVAAHDEVLAHKEPYLDVTFFVVRALVIFAVWAYVARRFHAMSVEQDTSRDPELTHKMQRWAGPALVFLGFSMTYGAIDWMMSLEPHWYSTMWGVYYFAGSAVAIFAGLSLAIHLLQLAGLLHRVVHVEHMHDLGKLLFGFVVFWTYIAFSQYMLIWYANMPEETIWFAHRWRGSWQTVSVLIGVGHFAGPFFFLMSRSIKRRRAALMLGAAWLLVIHYVDIYWLVMPTLDKSGASPSLIDVLCWAGIGGLYLGLVVRTLVRHPLVPTGDPRLAEAVHFEQPV